MQLMDPVIRKQTAEYWMKKISIARDASSDYREDPAVTPILLTADLSQETVSEMRTLARNAVSEYTLLLSLYGFLLYRYFGNACLINSPDMRLFQPSLTDQQLFYAVDINERLTLKDLISAFREEIAQTLDKRDFDNQAFFETIRQKGISFELLQAFGFSHSLVSERTVLPATERIKLQVIEDHGSYQVQLRVNGLKDGALIGKQFLEQYVHLLSSLTQLLDKPLSEIPIVRKGITLKNPQELPPPVPVLFSRQAAAHPQKAAVVSRGASHTYAAIDGDSNKLSAYLAAQGVKKGSTVAILVPRSEWIITAVLSVLKTGAAFVPLDPAWPSKRIQYILEDAGVTSLLTTSDLMPLINGFKGKFFAFDIQLDMLPVVAAPAVELSPEDTAYIMYTSGTTGQPKGVMVPHRGISNYSAWLHEEFGLDTSHSSVLVTSYAFDLGYTAIWGTLPWGGTLHIPAEDYSRMPEKLFAYLAAEKISFIKLTPSLFKLLISAGGNALEKKSLHLRLLFLGGEMIRPADLVRYLDYYPWAEFVNHYGPTESTVGCIFHRIRPSEIKTFAQTPVIGSPIRNTRALILDQYGHVLPDGIWGDIAISSPGVAKGYLNKDQLTAEKFVAPGAGITGTFYRTGDYGRRLGNGTIELKGRRDNQAKIRGYRVELEEIESCLAGFNGIKETALLLQSANGDNVAALVAFYTTTNNDEPISEEVLLTWLKTQLPEYMIPSVFIHVDTMPVNENGKLNRSQLTGLFEHGARARRQQVLPVNATEQTILDVWKELLNRDDIGTTDSFFDVGGNSLLLVQVNLALNKFFPALTITDLFAYTNIAALAAFINKATEKVIVNEPQWGVRLSADHVNKSIYSGETGMHQADLYVKLPQETESRLRSIAAASEVALLDISTAVWAYALNMCAHTETLSLHLSDEPGLVKRLLLPIAGAESQEQLYRMAADNRKAPQQLLAETNLVRSSAMTVEPDAIWPMIRLSHPATSASIAPLFDIVLTVFDRHGNLAFSLQHGKRMYGEKMEELLQTFIHLLENAL